MTTATLKTLAEMTIDELKTLEDATFRAYRDVERVRREMAPSDPRRSDLDESREGIKAQYFRVYDELDRRGA